MSIKYVIKRDGTQEKFDVNKILRWELWACEGIKQFIDWKDIIIKTMSNLSDGMSTQDIQLLLIDECNNRKSWYNSIVAGRLYAAYISKHIYHEKTPTIRELHTQLQSIGLLSKLDYTEEEYEELERVIDHNKDFNLNYLQVYHIVNKYALGDKITKKKFETPQFVFMRMAMALSEDETNKLEKVKKFYKYFSESKINAPTPNYTNLGTNLNGYISCCLYTSDDDSASLAIGDHIAYTMTYMSAGIGGLIQSRSIGDPVKAGLIKHQGKLPYLASVGKAVGAMSQNSRGGSATQYFSCFDPEALDIVYLQNPRTPISKQNRDLHFGFQFNSFFVEKAYRNEDIFTFNKFTAPELYKAFYSGNKELFRELYLQLERDSSFKKKYVNARKLAIDAFKQAHEVATVYFMNVDEANKHTPFKDSIVQSNLCNEIYQPTKPYMDMMDLYSTEKHDRGEISLCALGGIIPSLIESDEEYEDVAYYTLLMIDKCIHKNQYVFPHLEYTAKSRMNAGVGIIGLAYELAKRGLTYSSKEGLEAIHEIAERHMYFLIKASIQLGKEKGNAEWMHKTKWVDGWLPIDTYNRNIDSVANFSYKYDWEELRTSLIENKGMRNSSLVAHMPTETSSKATGMPNGVYPIRAIYLKKTDASNAIDFTARESDTLESKYEIAWNLTHETQSKVYGVIQKFTDQAISADFYSDRTTEKQLKATRLLEELFCMYKYGHKSRYYTNSKTTESIKLETVEDERGCSSGVCTL